MDLDSSRSSSSTAKSEERKKSFKIASNKKLDSVDKPSPRPQPRLPPGLSHRPSWRGPSHQSSPRKTSFPPSSALKEGLDDDAEKILKKNNDDAEGAAQADYPQGFVLAMIALAVNLSFFLVSLDMTIVATAIPKITDEFHGIADVSWYSSVFFMTTAGFQSTWGKAYKYFPLKTTFLASIAVFEVGSLLCGAAPTSAILIIGRAIAGVGGAGIGSGVYTILGFSVEPKKRPLFTGIVGASYGIASVLGPLLGGVLSDKVTWRWCFYINLPIGGISMIAIMLYFKAPATAKPQKASMKEKLLQMDPLGATLMMGAVISLILALQRGGQTEPWNSPTVIGLLVSAGILTFLFGGWEVYQGERAMIVVRLMKQRLILFPSLFLFFFAGAYFTVIYNLPIYFQSIDGTSPTDSGIRNLPLILAVSIFSILSGLIVSATGHAAPLMPLGAGLSIVGAGLIYTFDIGTEPVKWILYQVVAGIGFGLAIQLPMMISQSSVGPSDLASITAVIMFFQTIGAAILVSAAQAAFTNKLIQRARITVPDVSSETLIATGSNMLRQAFDADKIPGVLSAYMAGLKLTFAIVVGASLLALISSAFVPWKKVGQGQGGSSPA